MPHVPAFLARKCPHIIHVNPSSLDAQGPAVHKRGSHFMPRCVHDAAKSLARHIHVLSRGFLIQSLGVRKAQCLELVKLQHHFLEPFSRNTGRFVQAAPRRPGYAPVAFAPRHGFALRFQFYFKHMLIINQADFAGFPRHNTNLPMNSDKSFFA
jgi:hypothetical protein